jgi:general secretion pathway protein I
MATVNLRSRAQPRTSSSQRRGFTLIEVMIAVVILAVGMSSLFTSEAGAVRIAQRARTTTIATLLARCKMGEIEERIFKEGWPGEQIDGRDECCDGAEHDGFKCEWKVERIVMPDVAGEEDGATGGMTAGAKARDKKDSDKGKERGDSKGAGGAGGGGIGGGGGLGAGLGDAGLLDGDGGILDGFMSEFAGGEDSDPITSMAMQLTFPVMKPVIEEGVRRATVTVAWKEGDSEQSFDVVQFLVNESQAALTEAQVEAIQDMGGGTGGTTGGGTTGGNNPPPPPVRK